MKKAYLVIAKIHEYADHIIIEELNKNNAKGLVPSHGDILLSLYTNDKVTMKDIAAQVHRSRSTVTVLIDKLEKSGYVKRTVSDIDNRYTYISLTQKGLEFKPVFEKITDDVNEKLYQNISDSEYKTLDNLLDRVFENIKRR